ncbi:MAG TPA: tetratricopeptide repeat protein [Geminicoccaceae bacterium]|nr:tetratricopeptide repeat protein [Geminicoccaceae bacterium]
MPAPRLADLLATSLPALADRGRAGSGAANGAPPSQAAARLRPRRARSAARLIVVVGAIIGGFGLGIVANGGALLTGSKLGEAMLALDLGLFNRTEGAPPAARAPEPASRPPVATPQERPAVRASTPGPAAAGKAAAASQAELADAKGAGAAVQPTAPEHGRVAPARGEPAAAPAATATGWEALYAEGHRFQLRGNLVAAADAYRRAIRLNPHHPAILYDLGYVLQMQGRSDAAMDHYRRTIALEPDHAYAHYNLGYLLQERGESTAAGRHYEIAAGRLPGNPYIYYDWAWSLESAGDLAGAAALYRKTIEIDPDPRPGLDARRRLAALGVPARPE